MYVQDIAELVVKEAEDVFRLLDQGQKVRHVASTDMNERSSRSHSCFTITIKQKTVERVGDKESTTTLAAKINLVDLAGSERAEKTKVCRIVQAALRFSLQPNFRSVVVGYWRHVEAGRHDQ